MVSRTFSFVSLVHILKGPLTTDALFPSFNHTPAAVGPGAFVVVFLDHPISVSLFVPRITLPEITPKLLVRT